MGTGAPTPVVIPVHCAPKKAPCPKCGKHGRRKRKSAPRRVRTVAYKAVAFLEITCGEYQARCGCCTTFRNTPEGVLPRALYDNKVRDLVLERILDDGMSIERTLESLRREFLLELSTGFVYDVLRDRARQLDMAEHRREVLEQFSGTLCVDELHLGRFTLLLATDPLADLPVAFALVDANDQDHMRRFLRNLKNWGLDPEVVVTDGSNLYPGRAGRICGPTRIISCASSTPSERNRAPGPLGVVPSGSSPSPPPDPVGSVGPGLAGSAFSRPSGITWRISSESSPTMTRSMSNCKIRCRSASVASSSRDRTRSQNAVRSAQTSFAV